MRKAVKVTKEEQAQLEIIADTIEYARKRKHLTMCRTCQKAGVSDSAYSAYMAYKTANLATLIKICNVVGLEIILQEKETN